MSRPLTTHETTRPALLPASPGPLLVIAGPTGVGKSALGLAVARRVRGEIIVADSMQVYRGLDIGTGKPGAAERAAVPHHLLDICDATEVFSAAQFAARAHAVADEIRGRGAVPILVGGSGLYLRAFFKGRLAGPGGDLGLRSRLRAEADQGGPQALYRRLQRLDPVTAARVRPGDLLRIIRALELFELTGRPPSEIRAALWEAPRVAVSALLVLSREREELYALIEARARRMWEEGLVGEVRRLLSAGLSPEARSLQSLGYRQALAYLQGGLTAEEALADMQRATRNYAKRQLTWFRREPAAEWISIRGWDWVEPLAEAIARRLTDAARAPGVQVPGGGA